MKLNCKRIDFTYTPGEEIFNFPEESGLPFLFDVDEELTDNPSAMDAVGEMLISFKTVKKSDWDKGEYKKSGYAEITHDGVSSYICKIGSAADDELTLESVRKSFKLLY